MTNNTKQLSLLASPLQKIADASESASASLMQIHQVVINMNTLAMETVAELKKQTNILTDIRSILREQNKSIEKGAGAKGGAAAGKFTPMSAKDVGLTAMMILGIAGAIVGAAGLFTLIPVVSGPQFLTALGVTAALLLITPAMYVILKETKGMTIPQLIFASLAIPLMAMGIVGAAYAFQTLPSTLMAPDPIWVLKSAFAIGLYSVGFYFIMKAIKGASIKELLFGSVAIPLMALGITGVAAAFAMFPSNPLAPEPLWVLKSALAIGLYAVGFYFIMKAIKGASTKELVFGAIAIPLMALSITGVAWAFQLLGSVTSWVAPEPLWVLKSAFAIGLYAVGFYFIMKAIKGANIKEMIFGTIAIPLMALGIVGTAWAFQLLGDVKTWMAPDAMWTLKAGFALLVFSIPFYIVSKAIKNMNLKELLFMTVAIPVVAFGILATAWIFQALAGIAFFAPEADWTLKAGLAVVIFGAMLYLSSKTIGQMGIGDMLKALVGVVVAAFAVVAVAWILQLSPSKWVTPPYDWTLQTGLALGVMGAAIAAMGLAVMALTPATLLLGALGIIVAAITILAVGWILAGLAPVMPSLIAVSQGITTALLAPVNGIIDVFARLKNEIGIENMIDLAIGLAALGGAWLIFTAAVGGASVVGGIGNAIGGLFEGIGKLFGGDQPSPIELLERIAAVGPKIQGLAKPLYAVGKGFSMINVAAGGVMKAFRAVIEFHESVDADDFTEQAKATKMIANSYKIMSDASRTMNIKAIHATTNMFKALDDLAKNGGESAMGILAEKLMVAVKELTGTVVNLEKSVEKQGNATSGIGDALSGAIDTVKETVTGVKKNVDKMNKDTKDVALDLEPLIKAINDLEDRFDSAIKVIDVTNR